MKKTACLVPKISLVPDYCSNSGSVKEEASLLSIHCPTLHKYRMAKMLVGFQLHGPVWYEIQHNYYRYNYCINVDSLT